MSNKEKWVDLFEQVVGRKPSPDEFLAGRDSGFDFKLIKRFVDEGQVVETVEELAPEQDSLDLAKAAWLEAFEARTGRKPSPAEFTLAKSQGFDLASVEQVLEVSSTPVSPQEVQVPQSPKKSRSLKGKLLALFGVLVIGLGGAYYYFDSQTGLDVAVEQFGTAVKEKNYTALADLLSNKDKKWSNSEAKSFVTYLDEHFEGLDGDLETIVSSKGKYGLTDTNDNVLVTFEPSETVLGLFQNYKPKPEGLTLTLKTNLSEATASLDGRSVSLAKDKETVLDNIPFAKEKLMIKGKTGVGPIESIIVLDLDKVEGNRLSLDLTAEKHELNISLPAEASSVDKLELVVNGQKIAEGLTGEVEALSGQQLEVHANFTVNGDSYTTNKSKLVVGRDSLELSLGLSSDTKKRLVDSEKAKKTKDEEAQKAKEAELKQAKEAEEKRKAELWSVDKQQALARYMVEFGNVMGQPNYQRIPVTRKVIWSGVPLDSRHQIVDAYEYWYDNARKVHRYIFVIQPNGQPVVLYSEDTNDSDHYTTKVTQNDVLPAAFYDIVY